MLWSWFTSRLCLLFSYKNDFSLPHGSILFLHIDIFFLISQETTRAGHLLFLFPQILVQSHIFSVFGSKTSYIIPSSSLGLPLCRCHPIKWNSRLINSLPIFTFLFINDQPRLLDLIGNFGIKFCTERIGILRNSDKITRQIRRKLDYLFIVIIKIIYLRYMSSVYQYFVHRGSLDGSWRIVQILHQNLR